MSLCHSRWASSDVGTFSTASEDKKLSAMSSSLVNSLAKVYDPNPLHGQKSGGRKLSLNGLDKSQASPSPSLVLPSSHHDAALLRSMEVRMDSLTSQMERLLSMQQSVLTRLDGLSRDVQVMGRDLSVMRDGSQAAGRRDSGVTAMELCRDLGGAVDKANERVDSHGRRLDRVEKLVEGTQQVISFIGEVVKSSRLVELLFKHPGSKKKARVEGNLKVGFHRQITLFGSRSRLAWTGLAVNVLAAAFLTVSLSDCKHFGWLHSESSDSMDGRHSPVTGVTLLLAPAEVINNCLINEIYIYWS